MKFVKRARGEGKTYELMKNHFLKRRCILIVISKQEKLRLIDEYKLDKEYASRILTMNEDREMLIGRRNICRFELLIDNLDMYLLNKYHLKLGTFTYTEN